MSERFHHIALGFRVNINNIRPCIDEPIGLAPWVFNHQMTVNFFVRVSADRLYIHDSHREVWDKIAIHDITVKYICPGIIQRSDFVCQMTVVGAHH